MNDLDQKPGGNFWISVLAIIGCFLIFAVVLYVAYLPGRSAAQGVAANLTEEERLQQNLLTPEERKARLAEMRAKEQAAARHYEWIDRGQGVVRLPIDRAVELTVRDLRQK